MFGVGMHFSLKDLLQVKRIALPGAILQITVATLLGMAVSFYWGWSFGAALVFGLSLSCASTVVLLKALGDQGLLDSVNGKIAVGWLLVEDLVMVLVLVLLPATAVLLGGHALEGQSGDQKHLGNVRHYLTQGCRLHCVHVDHWQTPCSNDYAIRRTLRL